jgi:rubrerythrin
MSVKKTLSMDLKDEKKAKLGYRKLAKKLKAKGLKQAARTIIGISRDEADHHRLISKIQKKV